MRRCRVPPALTPLVPAVAPLCEGKPAEAEGVWPWVLLTAAADGLWDVASEQLSTENDREKKCVSDSGLLILKSFSE